MEELLNIRGHDSVETIECEDGPQQLGCVLLVTVWTHLLRVALLICNVCVLLVRMLSFLRLLLCCFCLW